MQGPYINVLIQINDHIQQLQHFKTPTAPQLVKSQQKEREIVPDKTKNYQSLFLMPVRCTKYNYHMTVPDMKRKSENNFYAVSLLPFCRAFHHEH